MLVAPIDTPGIEVRRFPVLGGGYLCEVFLDGVEIDAGNLVGERGGGWDVLLHTLDFERITAEKLGGLAWVLDGLELRLEETGQLDGVWRRIASLRGELAAARLLSLRAADLLDRGEPANAASAMAKLSGARLAQRLAREATELLGLEGLSDARGVLPLEGRVGALYRASVGSTISGGSAEIQRRALPPRAAKFASSASPWIASGAAQRVKQRSARIGSTWRPGDGWGRSARNTWARAAWCISKAGCKPTRMKKRGSPRLWPKACAPGRQAQCGEHGAALQVPHRRQERAEGRGDRGQGQGRRTVPVGPERDRFGGRQGHEFHKNKAARHKSRLAAKVKSLATAA